jgi:phage-related protein
VATWRIEEYGDFLAEFLRSLTTPLRARAVALIARLRDKGNELGMPHSRPLGHGVHELRDVPSGARMFYVFRPDRRVVFLGGIVKKRGDIPTAVLKLMRARGKEAP